MSHLKIGVTGSAGSGKSLVCKGFEKMGLVVLDCDRIAREVVEPGQKAHEKVVRLFGCEVLKGDQQLDRAGIRKVIVDHPDMRQKLENILHPIIIEEMNRQMSRAICEAHKDCAVEVPLLFELGMERYFDVTLAVVARDAQLVQRIARRDQVETGDAKKILRLQMAQEEKISRADHVIENTGSEAELFQRLGRIYDQMKKKT